jgi:hypothetical protein
MAIIMMLDWWSIIVATLGVCFGGAGLIGVFNYLVNSSININIIKDRDKEIEGIKSERVRIELRYEKEMDDLKDEIKELKKSIEAKNEAILKMK